MSEFINYVMDPQNPWRLLEIVLDLMLVYYAIYRFLMTMRGTKALQVLMGVLLVMLLYIISGTNVFNLVMTRWVLDKFMLYSETLGKDILLPVGTELKCSKELATQLRIAGKVEVIGDENNIRTGEVP